MEPTKKKIHSISTDPASSAPTGRYINISSTTVLKIIAVLAGIFFLWMIRDVIGILFVALVFASALDPWIDYLERYRIPRGVSIFTMYVVFFAAFIFVFYLVVPPIIRQTSDIAQSLREYAPQIERIYKSITHSTNPSIVDDLQNNISSFNSTLSNLTSGIFNAVTSFLGAVVATIVVLIITFYMTIEEDGFKRFVRSIAPIHYQPYLVQKINRIQEKMGAWLRGQLILMLIIGILVMIGLSILQVPYALVLGCLAGLTEFIPYLGPLLASIPAIFFAYTDSPWKAVAVIILYIVIQQAENHIIVPKIMQKAVGLDPIVVILSMLIGAKVAGFAGILLAVPATTIVWIFVEDIIQHKIEEDNKLAEPLHIEEKLS